MLALDNELVFLAHVPRAEELLVVLAVKQRCLVTIQSSCHRYLTNEIILKRILKHGLSHQLAVSKASKTDLDMQVLGGEREI